MTLLDHRPGPATDAEKEALIKEARRLRRRRWLFGCALTALAIAAVIAGYLIASGPPAASHRSAPRDGSGAPSLSAAAGAAAPTRTPDLIQPTSLAALPDGNLLILDSSRDQILELRHNGDLAVFAGNGRLGLSGDSGQARDAELRFGYFSSGGIAVTPNGSVDILDDGNCRVRQVSPNGIIRTLVRLPRVKVGGSPRQMVCSAVSVAVSPAGEVYIATDSQIERLTSAHRLAWVAGSTHGEVAHEPADPTPSSIVFLPDAIAFNRAGDLYIGSLEPKAVYRLTPSRKLADLQASYPTALATQPNGSVLVGTHFGVIQRASSTGPRLHPYYDVNPKQVQGIHWDRDEGFQENGIALTRNGTIYVDNSQGNGFGASTVLVRITPTKHAALVPIRTTLTESLPKLGASGFPPAIYPQPGPSRSATLTSCPSDAGLQRFTAHAVTRATRIARTYLSSQFASDLAVTDRSWWTADFADFARGENLGRHTITDETPASTSPAAAELTQACGSKLVDDSIAVTVGRSAYSNFKGTLYFLDRNDQPLVYDVR